MSKITNPQVAAAFNDYPRTMRKKLLDLRQLVLDTASETEGVDKVEETLKWGEPSYLAKKGSTIRMAWKEAQPDQYAMYFICTTSLLDTFKALYGDVFKYDGNRAIVFDGNDELPVAELKHCVSLALTYHNVKHLPLLGAQ
ncbi:MAG: DUF1801 domain-containing protein [Chloroflexi bacterium]|nr:MAG: DUF1801 domain-containing protein [Chloroflexota bacterium]MBL1197037.1 DUF1801 domain-containing protein [Chloroflexota bacterium]NOH14332.1 DUF1801 domain-containing protein [Chloroflexota bacterium]